MFKFLLPIRALHFKLYVVLSWNQKKKKKIYIYGKILVIQVSLTNKHR